MELGKILVESLFQESDQIDIIAFKLALHLSWLKLLTSLGGGITYLFGLHLLRASSSDQG